MLNSTKQDENGLFRIVRVNSSPASRTMKTPEIVRFRVFLRVLRVERPSHIQPEDGASNKTSTKIIRRPFQPAVRPIQQQCSFYLEDHKVLANALAGLPAFFLFANISLDDPRRDFLQAKLLRFKIGLDVLVVVALIGFIGVRTNGSLFFSQPSTSF